MSNHFDSLNLSSKYNIDNIKIYSYDCLYDNTLTKCETKTNRKNLIDILNAYHDVSNNEDKSPYALDDMNEIKVKIVNQLAKLQNDAGTTLDTYNDVNSLRNNISDLRSSLDSKLDTIHKGRSSYYDEYQSHYESTMMAGIMWGTLAGTVIYYVFYS